MQLLNRVQELVQNVTSLSADISKNDISKNIFPIYQNISYSSFCSFVGAANEESSRHLLSPVWIPQGKELTLRLTIEPDTSLAVR